MFLHTQTYANPFPPPYPSTLCLFLSKHKHMHNDNLPILSASVFISTYV